MISEVWLIAKKEFIQIWRDKRSLLLVFLPIAVLPITNLMAGVFSGAVLDESKQTVLIVDQVKSDYYKELKSDMKKEFNYRFEEANDISSETNHNNTDLIIEIMDTKTVKILSKSSVASASTAMKISEYLDDYINKKIENELTRLNIGNEINNVNIIQSEIDGEKSLTESYDSISAIIMISMMFQGVTIYACDMFAGEREKKTLELIFLSRANRKSIIIGKYLALLIVGAISYIITFLSYYITLPLSTTNFNCFEFVIKKLNFNTSIMMISLAAMLILSVGMYIVISLVSKNIRQAQFLNQIVSFIPSGLGFILLLGGTRNVGSLSAIVPFYNLVIVYMSALQENVDITYSVISIITTLLIAMIMMSVSFKLIKSEKVLI
ncbi:MAG: ABC transporter permease [Oscillospiraceae bacterium]|nr:ABC transporter permease [Oscillospiraceae bacterium]